MEYTKKGKWRAEINPLPLPRSQGSFVGYIRVGDTTIAQLVGNNPTLEANAHLIAAAVNACIKLNPDNPMAVAESISDLYEALEEADVMLEEIVNQMVTTHLRPVKVQALWKAVNKTLAKARSK